MKTIYSSRREFIFNSALAAAAGLAAPYVCSADAPKKEAKNDRLNFAVVGTGGRASQIIPNALKLGDFIACADVNRPRAEKYAKRFAKNGKCKVYDDYRDLLARRDIDVVLCATPDHWHVKVATDAMKAGKDAYCEKPLTLTIGEGKLIRKVVEDTGKILQIGTQQRSEYPSKYPNTDRVLQESFLAAVAIAQSGRLGDTLRAEYHIDPVDFSTFPEPIKAEKLPGGFNWDFWLGQAPVTEYCPARSSGHFRYWFEYAGGEVTDGGVHHMDIALWALGGDKTGVVEADATGEFQFDRELIRDAVMGKKEFSELPRRFNTEVTCRCDYRLPNSQNVLTFNTAPGDFSIYIQGEKGRIRVNRVSGLRGKPIEDIVASGTDWKWLQGAIDKLYRGMPRENHMANFFYCVKTREKPVSDVWTHVNTANACHMANISMLLGRRVHFDPDKYQFIADDDANLLINRKQRKPWTIA